jgi:ABC-type nickel/cobalt efflux system permease component RcnA
MMSAGAIALVGVWLVIRGLRRVRRASTNSHDHDHHHDHVHGHGDDHACSECGHAHGPDPEDIARVSNWREGLGLVLAVAVRPCTGAVFILILTFGMGIAWVGMLGALVMGLGTAVLTLCVALGAGFLRSGFAAQMNGTQGVRAMGIIEILAGAVVAILSTQILLRLL